MSAAESDTIQAAPARKLLLAYGLLALPLAFSGLPMYVYAPDLYTNGRGVPLAQMGIFLLFIRLLDAVQDPVIGACSDRWHRWRFHAIGGGLALLGVSFIALYNPPDGVPALGWFISCMIGAAFAFSTVSINYNALGSLWRDRPRDKTAIVAARERLGLVGLLLATLSPALLRLQFSADVSYRIYALLFLALSLTGSAAFQKWRMSIGRTVEHATIDRLNIFDFRLILRRPFTGLFAVYGLSTLASAIPGVLVVFFIRDRLQAETLTGPFLALYFLAGIAGMPLWKIVAARIGKKRGWQAAMLLSLVCFIGAYWLRAGDLYAYGTVCFFSGLALGAELILPLSMASDLIDQTGQQARTSSVFAVLLFTSKLSLALASGGAFLVLARHGYVPGAAPTPQSGAALSFVYALLPCAVKGVAIAASRFLPADESREDQPNLRTTK